MVDTRGGAVAARIAMAPAAHAGRTYWPTGPQSLTYSDAAAALSRVLGRTITFHALTKQEQEQAMVDEWSTRVRHRPCRGVLLKAGGPRVAHTARPEGRHRRDAYG